jgi:hypothetical protein
VSADARAIVECLIAAHYSEHEILAYLIGPLGLPEATALAAIEAARGPVHFD